VGAGVGFVRIRLFMGVFAAAALTLAAVLAAR
jgi:hypothetical protein